MKQATLFRGSLNGGSAEAQFSDDLGGGILSVFQNGSTPTLLYAIWGNDPTSEVCDTYFDPFGNPYTVCVFHRSFYDYGWGAIPSGDAQFTPTSAHLLTTTGAGFTTTHCVTDSYSGTPVTTCGPGGPGTFDVSWTASSAYSIATTGTTNQNFGSFTFKSTGTFRGPRRTRTEPRWVAA